MKKIITIIALFVLAMMLTSCDAKVHQAEADEEIPDRLMIRKNFGEWEEPIIMEG